MVWGPGVTSWDRGKERTDGAKVAPQQSPVQGQSQSHFPGQVTPKRPLTHGPLLALGCAPCTLRPGELLEPAQGLTPHLPQEGQGAAR